MKITKITIYTVPLDAWDGASRYNDQQIVVPSLDSTVVRFDTDSGLFGIGETCTPPPYYLPVLSSEAVIGISYLAPLLLGRDPGDRGVIYQQMREALRGHANVIAALDMALWDLYAKSLEMPLYDVWGGRISEDLPVLAMVSIGTPQETLSRMQAYRAQGYDRFQIKIAIGSRQDDIEKIRAISTDLRPHERAWFDVNRGWTVEDALRVLSAVSDLDILIEQPCETYEACRIVSRRTGVSMMLDEALDSPQSILRAYHDGVINVAVLKMSDFGGLSMARVLCDLCVRLGIPMRIEDFFGTGITFAAVTHLAHALPRWACYGLYDYIMPEVPLVENPLRVQNGRVNVEEALPGLGIRLNAETLGEPVKVLE